MDGLKSIVDQMRHEMANYQKLVEKQQMENLDWEETENLGAYKGKVELYEEYIPKLSALL
jgi:hypothetical protein